MFPVAACDRHSMEYVNLATNFLTLSSPPHKESALGRFPPIGHYLSQLVCGKRGFKFSTIACRMLPGKGIEEKGDKIGKQEGVVKCLA